MSSARQLVELDTPKPSYQQVMLENSLGKSGDINPSDPAESIFVEVGGHWTTPKSRLRVWAPGFTRHPGGKDPEAFKAVYSERRSFARIRLSRTLPLPLSVSLYFHSLLVLCDATFENTAVRTQGWLCAARYRTTPTPNGIPPKSWSLKDGCAKGKLKAQGPSRSTGWKGG